MNSPAPTPDAFAPAIAALGREAFASELLAALNQSVPVDHVCLMRVADRARPPVLESASWRGGDPAGTAFDEESAYVQFEAGNYLADSAAAR